MITFILTFVISINCYSFAVAAEFEGIIYAEGAYVNEPYRSKMYIKGTKVRLETESWKEKPLSVVIYNLESQSMFILTPPHKVFEGPIEPALESLAQGKKRKFPPIIRTGKIENIAGLPAEQFTRTHKDGRVSEYWITRSLNFSKDFLERIMPFVGHVADDEMHSKLGENQWKIRKVERWPDGSIWFFEEVTKVNHSSIQDNLFIVPQSRESR